MYLKIEKPNNYANVIRECYSECPRTQLLHNDYAGYNLEQCVQDVLNKIDEWNEYVFFSIYEGNKLIGYFGVVKDLLHTFFVKPKYRHTKELTEVWRNITTTMPLNFCSFVYRSNDPAKRFLSRNKGKKFNYKNVTYFTFLQE